MKVIFVSHFEPKPVGHGGNHRAYQIVHDLERVMGVGNVIVVSLPSWRRAQSDPALSSSPPDGKRPLTRVRSALRGFVPLRVLYRVWRGAPVLLLDRRVEMLADAGLLTKLFAVPEFIRDYEQVVQGVTEPAVCLIEHVGFSSLLPINSRCRIPTIACIQNLESFDTATLPLCGPEGKLYNVVVNFAYEYRVLALCTERLFISRVETGLVGGLGLPSQYYPYVPVGGIRRAMDGIRRARREGGVEAGFFLMLGTARHKTAWDSFSWFVQNVRNHGLPNGVCIVVGGLGTDELLPPAAQVPGLELRGWLDQDELDQLLVRAQAVIVPHRVGFGALTRLAELACAGIPAIVSRHPAYTMDLPPGCRCVDDSWADWHATIQSVAQYGIDVDWTEYAAWEKRQPDTIGRVLRRMLLDEVAGA